MNPSSPAELIDIMNRVDKEKNPVEKLKILTGYEEKELLSNCCGAIADSMGLCSSCREHCEFTDEE